VVEQQLTFADLVKAGDMTFGDGYRTKKSEHGKPGLPILRVAEVHDGSIRPEFTDYVSDTYRSAMGAKVSRRGDIVLTTKGTVGRVAIVPAGSPEFVYSPQVCFFRAAEGARLTSKYLYYWFKSREFWSQAGSRKSQTDMADYLNLSDIRSLSITVPDLLQQHAVVDVLGALDEKISVNERIAATARELGLTFYSQSLHHGDSSEVLVESISAALTRGVAPKYTDSSDELIVLNQKCIRNGRVNLEPSRLTLREKVKESKLLQLNDVLVNSTGVGTLGRVARWTSELDATVDSHITIVRFNEDKVDPVCAGFAMLQAQPEIEAMGEGSTGQTELRRSQVGELELALPGRAGQKELRPKLDALDARADQALSESLALAVLRDTLLPQLMSGKLRVRDAEKIVEDAV
jgi:type I restriction enzyme S subunit